MGKEQSLTKNSQLRVLFHTAQRRERVEPDHRGMHEELSHRNLCDLGGKEEERDR